ncbi:MAG: hypothetical protein JWO36_7278 [Myxococcales bacterium]|nr:hypothetical protein [Myxococcales bacterium]
MPDPIKPTVGPRVSTAFPPRWGFVKGLLTGAVIEVPALASAVWVLARLGIGDPDVGFMRILRLTTVFCGIAAVFTAAGVGRLAAHASVDTIGGRKRAVYVAARAHAAAGAGLLFIAVIPHGHLPDRGLIWLPIPLVGLACGALCGAVIGMVCGGAAPVSIGDVMALARKPSEALRQLLDPEDLLKIGAAVRDRTTHLFGGMFEPAQRPPGDKSEDVKKAIETVSLESPAKEAPRE